MFLIPDLSCQWIYTSVQKFGVSTICLGKKGLKIQQWRHRNKLYIQVVTSNLKCLYFSVAVFVVFLFRWMQPWWDLRDFFQKRYKMLPTSDFWTVVCMCDRQSHYLIIPYWTSSISCFSICGHETWQTGIFARHQISKCIY